MSLLNAVNVTVDTIQTMAGELRLTEIALADELDAETRAAIAKELGLHAKRLEQMATKLHEERRLECRR